MIEPESFDGSRCDVTLGLDGMGAGLLFGSGTTRFLGLLGGRR